MMRKPPHLLSGFFLAASVLACGSQGDPNAPDLPATGLRSELARNQAPSPTAPSVAALIDGNHRLTLDLFGQTASRVDNYTVSTLSIRTAFALVYAGARGQTATEMSDVLYYDANQARFHEAMNALDLQLTSRALPADPAMKLDAVELRQANAFWGQLDFPWDSTYLDTLAVNYGAGIEVLDFPADPEQARQTINQWVESKTEKRIKNLLPQGSIRGHTRAVLTNALYFKAPWLEPFEPALSSPGTFNLLAPGGTATVDFMRGMPSARYAQGTNWTAVELPFRGDELSMVFVVPDAQTFAQFEQGMDAATLQAINAALQPGLVELSLPKFEFEASFQLKAALEMLGMPTPFSSGADLTGMASRGGLAIEEAYHKTFIAIDETGAEAAAATAVVVGETSVPVPDLKLDIDRPFFFMIRDRQTDVWLFFGRVLDPS